jgi:cytochrome P450
VIKESMRLYPPAWMVGRRLVHHDTVGGYDLPAGTLLFFSPYVTQRHPAFWENPEGFDPDRFLPEREASRPKYAYFPFGGGPRICIGNTFATMEAVLILATIVQRVDLDLVPGHLAEPEFRVTLRPKYGMKMRVERR